MGLLSIWEDYWKKNELSEDGTYGSSADLSNRTKLKRGQTERSNLSTAGGVEPTGNTIPRVHRKRGESPSLNNTSSVPFQSRMTGKGPQVNQNISRGERARNLALTNPNVENVDQSGNVTYKQDASKTTPTWVGDGPWKMRSGADSKFHTDGNDQQKWWQTFANKIGFDYETAKATWKDKGGFEGLMANPAFTMGLAFMSAGAEGKNLGQGALDNVMKAAGISSHYKKILKDREEAPIEVTATDVGEVKSLLQSLNVSAPSNIEKFWGKITGKGNMMFKWDLAAEQVAVELQKEMNKIKKNKKPGDPEVVYDTPFKLKVLKKMLEDGKFKKVGGGFFFDSTLQSTIPTPMAEGGPIEAGKPYLVGEKGPEVIIPNSDGNVIANDDSQIFAMLLASNPQLQNVSKQRAEKILRNRFPEYFE